MPLLRRLELSLLERGSDPIPIPNATFCDAPLLRTVLLNGHAAQSIKLPWAQLTSLALREVKFLHCVPILQCTVNLLDCSLSFTVHSEDDKNLPRIALLFLRSLILEVSYNRNRVTGYLEAFDVPALRRLQVHERLLHDAPISSLTSFISKTGCQLQELRVTNATYIPGAYILAFPSTNVSVKLDDIDWDSDWS
ncbi:hypothetical protein MSAN_00821100 [Mycena sanguinolenta]|uniref:Uncharacterized protein n=1 Tax=Mycena sanguinolenta TaxID=230812 RepID=A0A8H6YZG6_9AGAR|nr:hypothetical protein MSAN_00821100 [Mycena sanguinolenta]